MIPQTSTQLTQIVLRLVAVLQANAACPPAHVWTDRTDAETREESPGINVIASDVSREPIGFGQDKCEADIELRLNVRAGACTVAVEAFHLSFHAALIGDAGLLSLADTINLTSESFDRQEADETSIVKSAHYRFTFSTDRSNL